MSGEEEIGQEFEGVEKSEKHPFKNAFHLKIPTLIQISKQLKITGKSNSGILFEHHDICY